MIKWFFNLLSSRKQISDIYKIKVEFDIPKLLNLDIDVIRKLIGHPIDEYLEPKAKDKKEWKENWIGDSFYSNDYTHDFFINVGFNTISRKVNFIYISENNCDRVTADRLLKAGNLQEDNSQYIIDYKMAGVKNDILTGLEIRKAHPNP